MSAYCLASSSSTLQLLGFLSPVVGSVLRELPRHELFFLREILLVHPCLNQTLKGSKVHVILCFELLHLLRIFGAPRARRQQEHIQRGFLCTGIMQCLQEFRGNRWLLLSCHVALFLWSHNYLLSGEQQPVYALEGLGSRRVPGKPQNRASWDQAPPEIGDVASYE